MLLILTLPGVLFDPCWVFIVSGEVFVVQWEQVRLLGRESEGAFTFQAALHKTGAITFSYRDVSHISTLFLAFFKSVHIVFLVTALFKRLFVCLPDTAIIRCDQFSSASVEGGFV